MVRDEKLDNDEDFIVSSKHGNSLKKLLKANPNGVSDEVIARVMDISVEEVDLIFKTAMAKLRLHMGQEDE